MKKIPIKLALKLSEIFWPEFVKIKGCVFLKEEAMRKNFLPRKKRVDPVRTESDSSHTHVFQMIEHRASRRREPCFDSTHSHFKNAYEIGRKICLLWALKLMRDFPRENFRVYLHGFDPTVRFHKIRKGKRNWTEAKYHPKEVKSGEMIILDTRKLRLKKNTGV